MTYEMVDELRIDPDRARVYTEGWQSWSPTTWSRWGADQHRPEEPWQHTMRFRPGTNMPVNGVHAEGLLVVDPGTGEPTRSYAITDASENVASIRAAADGGHLAVSADGPVAASTHEGPAEALEAFGDRFARTAGVGELRVPPRVWCTWYRYFESVTEDDVRENLRALDTHDLSVDTIQIDDGWSQGIGEWTRPTGGFPRLPRLVDEIRATGRRVGIWLAPFMVGSGTEVAHEHPEWLTGPAGTNWGQGMLGLDLTHPGVRDLLITTIGRLKSLGVDYFKLDFLYAGAIPADRYEEVSAIAAYRSGLELIREAAGEESYLLGCGAPILPSVGLVDAMRVSPDTFHEGGEDGSTGLRGRMSLVARGWQQGRFWVNDPDCLVARPTYTQREAWAETVVAYGGLRSFSDRITELDDWGLETTRRLMESNLPPVQFARSVVDAAILSGTRDAE